MGSDDNPQNVLVVLFVALFVGVLITYFLSRRLPHAPYTVVIFIAGLIISAIFGDGNTHGVLDSSLETWEYINPQLILYIFLPALLFGEAMSLNFHHIGGAIANACLLAGPGALFGSFATAAMAKWLFTYDWSWHLCFLFGAILCATDPVAVVALLKKVGASPKLTYMIIGEALINDGTALVLYNLLYALVDINADMSVTPLSIFLYFLLVVLASPLLGALFGFVTLYIMSIANRRFKEEDTTIQMAITLVCAYVSFYVAEYLCGVSGVICCCSAAVVLARFANPLILKPDALHSVWAALEWVCNTVIFFLAGIIICLRSTAFITATDVGFLIVTYIGVFVIRALMMVLFFPMMQRMGKGCTAKEALFTTWGGLRGAVSIALALSLVESTENGDTNLSTHDAHRILFFVGGTAAMTLTFNATTAGYLLKHLGLLKGSDNEEGQIMFHYAKKTIRLKAFKLLEQIQNEHPEMIDPDFVIHSCSIMHEDDPQSLREAAEGMRPSYAKATELSPVRDDKDTVRLARSDMLKRMQRKSMPKPAASSSDTIAVEGYNDVLNDTINNIASTRERGRSLYFDNSKHFRRASDADVKEVFVATKPTPSLQPIEGKMEDIRRAFVNVVRVRYWRQINTGRLPRKSSAALTLLNSIDVALEQTSMPGLQDWPFILKVKSKLFKDVLLAYQQNTTTSTVSVGNPMVDASSLRMPLNAGNSDGSYVAWSGETDAAAKKADFEKAMRDYRCSQAVYLLTSFIEGHRYAQRKIPFYIGQAHSTAEESLVVQESQEVVEHAIMMLKHINPAIVRRQLSKLAVRWILHMQEESIESFQKEGVITEEQAEALFDVAGTDMQDIKQSQWYQVLYYRSNQLFYAFMDKWFGSGKKQQE